ncbi:MAG: hypothetical protein HY951_14375 [Bacteroidia bacterium]|nr:hypothetical protein [Bacteroidia bacterium]
MGYKALITLDLNSTNDGKLRDLFYSELKNKHWVKISSLTTTWTANFSENTNRDDAIKHLITHLQEAKKFSKIPSVEYAIQLDKSDVVISKM